MTITFQSLIVVARAAKCGPAHFRSILKEKIVGIALKCAATKFDKQDRWPIYRAISRLYQGMPVVQAMSWLPAVFKNLRWEPPESFAVIR
jgi:hypothetical protein